MIRNPELDELAVRSGIVFDTALDWLPRQQGNDGVWGGLDPVKLGLAMDAVTAQTYNQQTLVTQPNAAVMAMLTIYVDPKVIEVLLAPMKVEDIYGVTKKGDWLTQTAYFPMVEMTGEAASYGDFNENGRSDFNANWIPRQSYNFQTFTEWGDMEVERYALAKIDGVARKNISSANTLNRLANLIGFYGVSGLNLYGGLNDPSLAAALTPATKAAGGTSWATALPTEILADIQAAYASLQSGVHGTSGNLERDDVMTLGISPVSETYIANTNVYGLTAGGLIKSAFPNLKIKVAPQYQSGSTYSFQLIVDELEGQRTCEYAFNEKMRAHRIVPATSSFKQKKSAGSWGTIIYRPICIASMSGI